MKKRQYAIIVVVFFLCCYIFPIGAGYLQEPDETRYGEIPREMIASGDWVVPHLAGLRYFEKPVMGYWVHAASLLVFGENNFAIRFPSVLSVGLTALLIYLLASKATRHLEKKTGYEGLVATLIYMTCFEVFGVGNIAVLDSVFTLFLTASIVFFYFATEEKNQRSRELWYLIAAGLSCGLAFMTKGFLAFAVPVLAIVPYLIWQRRYKDIFRMAWIPVLCAVVISLPWAIMIYHREPDFWKFFFWNEHIRRFTSGDNAQHGESFWFFFVAAPAMVIPWTFVIPAAISGLRKEITNPKSAHRLLRFSLCWMVVPFLFFSASSGKLLTYILPCLPPFAILMTFGLTSLLESNPKSKLFRYGAIVSGGLFAILLLVAFYVYLSDFKEISMYLYDTVSHIEDEGIFEHRWKAHLVLASLLSYCLLHFRSYDQESSARKIFYYAGAPFLLFFFIHFSLPGSTIERKCPGLLLEHYSGGITPETVVIADSNTARSVCWYLKRDDVYILGNPGEFDYGLNYPDAEYRRLDLDQATELINKNRGNVVFIGRCRNYEAWKKSLPEAVFKQASGEKGHVMLKY
jgi:4-amino-4-deoxy-L-arabinose transferase